MLAMWQHAVSLYARILLLYSGKIFHKIMVPFTTESVIYTIMSVKAASTWI